MKDKRARGLAAYAGTAAGVASSGGAAKKILHVGTRTQILGQTVTSKASTNCITKHNIPVACRNIQLVYANWAVQALTTTTGGEQDGPAQYTKLAAGFLPSFGGSTLIPVQFQGRQAPTLDVGGSLFSDVLGVYIPASTLVGVRTFMSTASDVNWFGGLTTVNGIQELVEYGTVASPVTDKSQGGTIGNGSGVTVSPTMILGVPDNPSIRNVAIIGDSIPTGTGDTADGTTGVIGYIERGLTTAVPAAKFTRGSDRLSYWSARRYCRMAMIAPYFTDAIIELGVNDFQYGLTNLAQMQSYFAGIRDELLSANIRVHACTITPVSTSTDSWATTGNQTTNTYNSVKNSWNDWLRAGVSGVTRVYEIADIVESSRNSGIWKANYTADGVHPNATATLLMAAAIKPSDFGY